MDTEYIVVCGKLTRDGTFKLRRAYSAPSVRRLHEHCGTDRRACLRLVDEQGLELFREPVVLHLKHVCHKNDDPDWYVKAVVPYQPKAAALELLFDDRLVWQSRLTSKAELEISVKPDAKRRAIALNARFSKPAEDAWMAVAYIWGKGGRIRVVYKGRPQNELRLDLQGLPGGAECRVAVSYSNGLRSARATSRLFSVPRLGPSVSILSPLEGATLVAGTHVKLQASLVDDEHPEGPQFNSLAWVVNGEVVGTGVTMSADLLSPGPQTVELVYRGEDVVRVRTRVAVVPARARGANEWPEWDYVSGNS